MDEVENILSQFKSDLSSKPDLETLKIKYLGRNGLVNELFKKINTIKPEERKQFGQHINELKNSIEAELQQLDTSVLSKEIDSLIDKTLPGIKPKLGHLHPTTLTLRKINEFFTYYGYSIYEGPEIETDEFCFEKLNLPKDHPAREMTDTLYIKQPEVLLRVHTSSVETRAMTKEELPIRIVVPGKVFRNETENATNNSTFYQYEGLAVDKNISMAELKGTLVSFVKFLYGKDTKTRFRCKYYPQVEPGAGLDVECTFCHGKGCQVCKYRGFIEVLGAGMVHPNVLRSCNIDSQQWSGFAFGIGLDRLVMLTYGIDDVRKLYNGELVFRNAL
jgi:phenylalanyl-tRNA synthetase alpha chain